MLSSGGNSSVVVKKKAKSFWENSNLYSGLMSSQSPSCLILQNAHCSEKSWQLSLQGQAFLDSLESGSVTSP